MTRAPFHLLKEGIYRQMILERQCQACYLKSDALEMERQGGGNNHSN
jgi:hypothetical protein